MLKLPGPHAGLRIGLFGGSFNPAHAGHLHVAETALAALKLDWIWWLPARGNPLKSDHGDYAERYAGAAAYANAHPRMRVSDIEVQGGFTYTIDLLRALKQRAPNAQFVWLMGSDSLKSFHKWKSWQEIAELVPIASVARPGSQSAALNSPFALRFAARRCAIANAASLATRSAPSWVYLPAPLNHLSSTQLRNSSGD